MTQDQRDRMEYLMSIEFPTPDEDAELFRLLQLETDEHTAEQRRLRQLETDEYLVASI